MTSETRDRLASHWASAVTTFPIDELPQPEHKFDRWSKALEQAMGAIVMTVTRDDNGSLHDWRYDPYEQRFDFQYQRLAAVFVPGEDKPTVVTVSSRFFVHPKNQKPGQREGPMWDELWVVGEEVRRFNEGVTKQLGRGAFGKTSNSSVTGGKTGRGRSKA